MKKSFLLVTTFAALIASSLAFTNAEEVRYKNLKVMSKKTTKEQMDVVMKHFTASLGVKCNHCHVYNQEAKAMDFASDANKHKEEARQMMKMTQKLNKKYFEWKGDWTAVKDKLEVTCYTCHGGKQEPSSWPAPPQRPGAPAAAPATTPPATQH
jgi:superfamily II DNA helicase RecQ